MPTTNRIKLLFPLVLTGSALPLSLVTCLLDYFNALPIFLLAPILTSILYQYFQIVCLILLFYVLCPLGFFSQSHLGYEAVRVVCDSPGLGDSRGWGEKSDGSYHKQVFLRDRYIKTRLRGGWLSQDLPGAGVLSPEMWLPQCILIINNCCLVKFHSRIRIVCGQTL